MKTLHFSDSDKHLRVEKILCLGRNYADHAKEMNAEVPEQPVVFIKPSTAIIQSGESVVMPAISREMHHEVEMVVVIGKEGRNIPTSTAMEYVGGYALGLDMTLRDIQSEAKKKGLPWSIAKGFDTSAPVSAIVEKEKIRDPHNLDISLKVNGKIRQQSNTRNMIFHVDYIISFLSGIFTLEPGDLIFTGTPEGVGMVVQGDILEAELESVGTLRVGVRKEFTD
jgi:2-keto-4-pentenoate hydratase/2-oxohepta-3-ene-1,7-dioic acid hydratase in catechol pathway